MKVKVSELEGRALNYAVAVCLWGYHRKSDHWHCFDTGDCEKPQQLVREWPKGIEVDEFNPSGNWAHGGPLIEMFSISVDIMINKHVRAIMDNLNREPHRADYRVSGSSDNVLVAVCRAVVKSHMRGVVDIPDELMSC